MRKEYGKALRASFAARVKDAAPEFVEVKVESPYFWPGDRAYRWKASEQLHCWIVLSPSKKDYDEFTVLIGWSKLGRYPELSMVPCMEFPRPEREEFVQDEYLTRLPSLWSREDRWWVVRELRLLLSTADLQASLEPISAAEAKSAVAPQVEDAIDKLTEIGVPYLQELARFVSGRTE